MRFSAHKNAGTFFAKKKLNTSHAEKILSIYKKIYVYIFSNIHKKVHDKFLSKKQESSPTIIPLRRIIAAYKVVNSNYITLSLIYLSEQTCRVR